MFNSNISETFWRTSSDNVLRKYSYSYDHLNRLLEGKYEKPQSTNPFPGSYDERLEYDKNGNILNLRRNGDLDSDSSFMYAQEIDVLGYTYKPDSNLLLSVSDDTANPKGFNDGNTQNDDFEYDNNGNITMDLNKNIISITYNHLNLPTKILFGNSNYIMYLYTASGQKMEKRIYENNDRTITDYINGFHYKTLPSGEGGLVFFPHAEGYVNVNESYKLTESSLFNYVFNYTDHLGNIRMSYTQTPTGSLSILEENHYYPFGLKHTNYNSDKRLYVRESVTSKIKPVTPLFPLVYNYKYNGKEWQDELGLNVYDYGARNYMADIGRWGNLDPKATKYYEFSPYTYCINNPLVFIDPTGMEVDTSFIYEKDKKGNYINPGLVKAFEFFAKSKQGIAFLGNFVAKGQVIAGHKYDKAGKFDKINIDLNFAENKTAYDATTIHELKEDHLRITVSLASGIGNNGNLDGAIGDIGHENFIHVDKIAEDYADDKKMNSSSIDKDINKWVDDAVKKGTYPNRWANNLKQHEQADKHDVLEKKLLPILQEYYKKKNITKTAEEIKKEINYYAK